MILLAFPAGCQETTPDDDDIVAGDSGANENASMEADDAPDSGAEDDGGLDGGGSDGGGSDGNDGADDDGANDPHGTVKECDAGQVEQCDEESFRVCVAVDQKVTTDEIWSECVVCEPGDEQDCEDGSISTCEGSLLDDNDAPAWTGCLEPAVCDEGETQPCTEDATILQPCIVNEEGTTEWDDSVCKVPR